MNINITRFISAFLLISILSEALMPSLGLCLTSGPQQPEVSSFTPVGTSEMIDYFSGDLNYNIPLLDVGGYPINISYHSGISMDQEASWTGLGWNINVGAVNRSVRGIPDDFRGENITRKLHMRPNKTFGANVGAGIELVGKETKMIKGKINFNIGARYNNYSGIGIEKSLNMGLSAGIGGRYKLNAGLGLSSSSDQGLSLQPSIGLSRCLYESDKKEAGIGINLGASFNSREGLKNLSLQTDLNFRFIKSDVTNGVVQEKQANFDPSASSHFDLGQATYVPQIEIPMLNYSFTGNFKLGSSLYALHPNGSVGGYYSAQELMYDEISHPAYGYMNSGTGQKFSDAILDFNREKDISFSRNTTDLPVSSMTYDLYSVFAQGGGGSFRAFRSDVGHVFDPHTFTTSEGGSASEEIGLGNLFHAGVDISETHVMSSSGDWTNDNYANSSLSFIDKNNNPLYEKYYFKEAGEKNTDSDPRFLASVGGKIPQKIRLRQLSSFQTVADNKFEDQSGNELVMPYLPTRKKRDLRNKVISTLQYDEMPEGGLLPYVNTNAQAYHTAEITSVGSDGNRFVYGLPAYNISQEEVSFSVGDNLYSEKKGRPHDAATGLVHYETGDDSKNNDLGLDNYYSNTILPPYAYAYLLTAVLSPDYVDADNTKGPSDSDLGDYTSFGYKKIKNYNWRVPLGENNASYNEGLKTDPNDDKASYLYGQKEIYYLDTIKTKNHIAIFYTSNRDDGSGVVDAAGKLDASIHLQKLDSICLFMKDEFYHKRINGVTAVALKKVHFVYNYSLCPAIPNNLKGGGKLTLSKIYFSFGNSNKARFSPYEFIYHAFNPSYNLKGYDRWGNYKNNELADDSPKASSSNIPTAEFPYSIQDKTTADLNASAWSLEKIYLPSGGIIKIKMESDDYAYVQNKQAMQMFKITKGSKFPNDIISDISDEDVNMYFQGIPGTKASDYFENLDKMYFRFLMQLTADHYEYVSGYADIKKYGFDPQTGEGYVQLKPVKLSDNLSKMVNPISKAAIQYLRLNRPKWAWGEEISGEPSMGHDFLNSLISSSFVKNIWDALEGPNLSIYNEGKGKKAIMNKSWIRLNNPNKRKYGGGARVAEIRMSDEWSGMTTGKESSSEYGQIYDYSLDDGTSSGVASYEPLIGGDENPWRRPVYFTNEHLLAPDDEHYLEEPFGENLFPTPSVGYSKVSVINLPHANVKRHATGKTVYEYYTSKDFPVITDRTPIEHIEERADPFSLFSLMHISTKNYMTATQGFTIELNDMNGKPRVQKSYQEDAATPFHSVEYFYKSKPYEKGSFRLDNTATVIGAEGKVSSSEIGVFSDILTDMREQKTSVNSSSISPNIDAFLLMGTVFLCLLWPSDASEFTQFRSAVSSKVFHKSGILEKTIVKNNASINTNENLAYDSETGQLILSSTNTNFDDKEYVLNYPAYWYYGGMGLASKNIGFAGHLISTGQLVVDYLDADKYFTEGDEVLIKNASLSFKAWIARVSNSSIELFDKEGKAIAAGDYLVKITRSGRKNQLAETMASTILLSNPLVHFGSNSFENILQASAVEFGNKRKAFCNCFDNKEINYSTNQFVNGSRGAWMPVKSYTNISNRSQSLLENNTNIRKDGKLCSFVPFYKMNAGQWEKDGRSWTFISENTISNPNQALESKDALGIYSSVDFGYKQSKPVAMASNSKYSEMAVDNFEDYHLKFCGDNHFKFKNYLQNVVNAEAHTGKYSMKVSPNSPVQLYKDLNQGCNDDCNISLNVTNNGSDTKIITASAALSPLLFSWEVLYGTPEFQLINTIQTPGTALKIYQKSWGADVFVTDAKGCKTKKRFFN